MHSDSSDIHQLSHNWTAITWQLGDRERQLRRSLVSPEETISEVMQRVLMEACVMGYLNKKIAFTEPEEFVQQWRVFVFRNGEEVELSPSQKVDTLSLVSEERLILRPQSVAGEDRQHSLEEFPGATGLPQSFIDSASSGLSVVTYILIGMVLVLVALVVLVLLKF